MEVGRKWNLDSGVGQLAVRMSSSKLLDSRKENKMDIITGKILKLNNWPDGKIIGLAKIAASVGYMTYKAICGALRPSTCPHKGDLRVSAFGQYS